MYRENSLNEKFTKSADLILVIALILLIVFIRRIASALALLPAPFGAIGQLLLLALIIGGLYFVYARRICYYRYSIFCREPSERELEEYGDYAALAKPLHTMIFERMSGRKGRIYEMIEPNEYIALLGPGKEYQAVPISALNSNSMTLKSKKTAHTLVYKRGEKLFRIYFHPSEELLGYVAAAVRNANGTVDDG